MQVGEHITVTCVDLDDEGAGVSEPAEGYFRVHIAGALPGERVGAVVEHVSTHGLNAWARLEAIEVTSGWRRVPACRAGNDCGGCVLAHFAYEAQLIWKRGRLERALRAQAALAGVPITRGAKAAAPPQPIAGGTEPSEGSVLIEAAIASPRVSGYRNRLKLVPARVEGRLRLGAYAPRSHDVIEVAGCTIVDPVLDEAAEALRALLEQAGVAPYDERTLAGDLRHVVLRANRDGKVLVVLVSRRGLPAGENLARALRAARPEIIGVVEHVNRGRGNAIFDERTGEDRVLDGEATIEDRLQLDSQAVELRLSAGAFFQANREVAGLAYAAIVRACAPRAGERVVDAYCGAGGIALALARGAGEVVGIEAHEGAVADAVASAALNGVGNARFAAGDVARELDAIDRADLVVVNPPRKGCTPAVLAQIVRLAPRSVAYLSCDPDTLARDLAWLAANGYATKNVTPFDMLPHTPHVEALAIVVPGPRA